MPSNNIKVALTNYDKRALGILEINNFEVPISRFFVDTSVTENAFHMIHKCLHFMTVPNLIQIEY